MNRRRIQVPAGILLLVSIALPEASCAATPAGAEGPALVRLSGTPEEVGKTWGEMNKPAIEHDFRVLYLKQAAATGISAATLIERSREWVRIAGEIAPHWLVEARAIARAAGVDEELYVSFIAGKVRNLFLNECTSYAVSRKHAKGGAILFHKTRDNEDRPQAAFVLESSLEGINKFIAVTDASVIGCSMMVNDKGLAGAADYPAHLTRKNDSEAARQLQPFPLPQPAEPRYRGMMSGALLRHIAETASSCREAREIIEDFVSRGYWAGGGVNGSHWLFVDRTGTILEVSNNTRHVVSQVHEQKVYFSRFVDGAAARQLRESDGPVDFGLFHGVARDRSLCFKSSISGMTAEIDPHHPDLLTCAWVTLPVRAISFPILMGQTGQPGALLNGEAYRLGTKTEGNTRLWETLERTTHASKESLKESVSEELAAGRRREAAALVEQWSQRQTEKLFEALEQAASGK
ncbi:MAG: hypothetical protein PHN77_05425 [Thermoguttaceae bacterium]|nr:hypothetical protein [Thermoguttaceae bacterium]